MTRQFETGCETHNHQAASRSIGRHARNPIGKIGRQVAILSGGLLALVWLIWRSGEKPSRLSYPCQRAALGAASSSLGVAAAISSLPFLGKHRLRRHRRLAVTTLMTVLACAALASFAMLGRTSSDNVILLAPPDVSPDIFLVSQTRGPTIDRFGGVDDLLTLMGTRGAKLYRSPAQSVTAGPDGLIDIDDTVLIKINAQWPERGGTNTDVLRGLLRCIVDHPDGFAGEVIVADNGQGRGSFNWPQSNAEDPNQSTQDVVDDFALEGWSVATRAWDAINTTSVGEYSNGDLTDGYVVTEQPDAETGIRVSYPKFRTPFGTYVSYKYGVWSLRDASYNANRLVVINVPVFKTHSIYSITASVKNHMGVVTRNLATDSHNAVARGGLGSVLAEVRRPDLTILDCIWILARPSQGPSASYAQASRRDQLLASVDPIALDVWATKYVMIPQIIDNGFSVDYYDDTQNPDNPQGVFRRYLDRTMSELLAAGVPCTNNYNTVRLHVWAGDYNLDGDVDLVDQASMPMCLSGPDVRRVDECGRFDGDRDDDIDLRDVFTLQQTFTGSRF